MRKLNLIIFLLVDIFAVRENIRFIKEGMRVLLMVEIIFIGK